MKIPATTMAAPTTLRRVTISICRAIKGVKISTNTEAINQRSNNRNRSMLRATYIKDPPVKIPDQTNQRAALAGGQQNFSP